MDKISKSSVIAINARGVELHIIFNSCGISISMASKRACEIDCAEIRADEQWNSGVRPLIHRAGIVGERAPASIFGALRPLYLRLNIDPASLQTSKSTVIIAGNTGNDGKVHSISAIP